MNLSQCHSVKWLFVFLGTIGSLLLLSPLAFANHRGSDGHHIGDVTDEEETIGHTIPGASFQVFWRKGKGLAKDVAISKAQKEETLQTVIDTFTDMMVHRTDYQRFDEALTKYALNKVIIEPRVLNRDGKEFVFLVARTKQKGRVNLLINAAALKEKGLVSHPDRLIPILAREFQWVVSKADTTKRRKTRIGVRKLRAAPIVSNANVKKMTEKERKQTLEALLGNYLLTEDVYQILKDQPYYEIGLATKISPAQTDSTSHFYDIRVREALHHIVGMPDFLKKTPKAVRSLLNGKIWNVSFAHIDSRDWATRTRVLPKDKAVKVGKKGKIIQPGKVLINLHRKAAPEDPYYILTGNLPMGALSTEQLAQVIALEIEHQIIEKSMRGHVAADEQSAP